MDIAPQSEFNFFISLTVAMLAGAFIGVERKMKGKSAGLKTNTLVAVGASLFVNISFFYVDMENVDMLRVITQVIVGVGFLGAGVIIQEKQRIKGLATAATIWCSAGVGCLAALQLYIQLVIAVIIIIFINLVFGFLNKKVDQISNQVDKQRSNE